MARGASLFLTLLALASFLSGCGGGTNNGGETASAVSTSLAPADLGAAIGDLYVAALKEVTVLLEARPDGAVVRGRVEALKESHVRRLVELGKQREALDSAGRASVDAAIRRKGDSLAGEGWYATYNSLQQYYLSRDQGFQELVLSFNTIGQYANFDILKKQEPGEARRLGIE